MGEKSAVRSTINDGVYLLLYISSLEINRGIRSKAERATLETETEFCLISFRISSNIMYLINWSSKWLWIFREIRLNFDKSDIIIIVDSFLGPSNMVIFFYNLKTKGVKNDALSFGQKQTRFLHAVHKFYN